MIQEKAIIKWNTPMGSDCFHLGLTTGGELAKAVPGQFVMVETGTSEMPLLRRPFSIFGIIKDDRTTGIELLVKVVGKGTRLLSRMQPGEPLNLLGPLGHGFRVNPDDLPIYLAAGGIGIAPIRFLVVEMLSRGVSPDHFRLFLGGRSKADLLCREEFRQMGIPVTITTDDGSYGDQCLITDPLEEAIGQQRPGMVYACGPHGMLVCVQGIVERSAVPCQISIETMMACGLGACLGCAVISTKTPDTHLHACVNGPVFNAADIRL